MNKTFGILFLVFVVLILIYASVFTVTESHRAIILKLGQIEKVDGQAKMFKPGLHFKLPFIEDVKEYDMRYRTLQVDSSRIVSKEQKDIMVDAYVVWQISDLDKFYRSTYGSVATAENLLIQYTSSAMRDEFGQRTIQELVNNRGTNLMSELDKIVSDKAANLGIKIKDVKIKQIDLPETVTESIYQRMSSEREKAAASIRAQGNAKAEEIRANADASVTVILAKAESKAKQIKAEGEAKALSIYSDSYNKSQPLFEFLKSMQTYDSIFANKNNTLILKPEGELFRYFNPSKQ
ncbi:protease modulator HflC [Thiotrichales bacterium 19S9-12]|nr:protease modulator HflC [Thiotrichales bacterium 19S9-11]MCF6812080.1 protease modulator HflC [Thiotrichales bacterium 19S9-12]